MKHELKIILFAVTLLALTVSGFALQSTLSLRGGASYPSALDTNLDKDYNGMIGISYEAWLHQALSLGLYPYLTKVSVSDNDNTFDSDIVGADLQLRFRPYWKGTNIVFGKDNFINRIAPYANLGVGISNYYPGKLPEKKDYTSMVMPSWGLGLTFMTRTFLDFDLGFQKEELSKDMLEGFDRGKNDAYWMAFVGISHTFGKKTTTPKYVFTKEIPLVLHGITFEFDSANLTPEAKVILDDVAASLMYYPSVNLEIQGHTDSMGEDDYNMKLSQMRADSVKDYLVAKGINSMRLTATGMGETRPIASNDTEEGRAQNRRIEFIMVK